MCNADAFKKNYGVIGTIIGTAYGYPLLGAAVGGAAQNAVATKIDVPTLAPTPVMPTMNSDAIAAARRESTAKLLAQGGRTSTILSQPSDQLGG